MTVPSAAVNEQAIETPSGSWAPADASLDPRGALPNLVVIGAQKCGTSGLHS